MTYNFKQKFEELEAQKLALHKDGHNNGQRGVFDRRRELSNVKNYLNDFVFGDLSNFKGKELVKKAQIYVTNEQYSRGLYIYEYAYAKKLVEKEIMEDYKKGVSEAEFKLNYKYHMIDGDLKFAKGDYINAADAYERAIDTKNAFADKIEESMSYSIEADTYSPSIRDQEAETKLLEAKAEALLHINEYGEAVDNYAKAIDIDPDNKDLVARYELAQKLQSWDKLYNNKWFGWLSPLWAPAHFYFAVRNKEGIEDLKIYKTIRRRAWIGIVVWLLIIGLIAALWFMKGRVGFVSSGTDDGSTTTAQAPTTPLDLCLYKGDRYMEMLSPETPHYIDSAIYFYRRALRYDNTDTIAKPRYNRAMITRNEMVTQIQRNIREDSATYFLSLRRPTEGLRLFKYKYDPRDTSKRKFGFVDTLGNVVIPPFFDFNYKTMDEQGETFYNGRAKVCLEVAPEQFIYFYIDQRGNKIEE
jgi:tetratricopeptide (TPR) repeat protein